MVLALKRGGDGQLAVFTASDTLSIDDIDRLSGSGNMTIGASLGAAEELRLASVAGLTRVLGDLVIDGQMDDDLDMGGNAITNVGNVDGVDVSAHASRHVLGAADELDGDELDVDFAPSYYTPATGTPGSNVDHLAAHLRGIDNELNQKLENVSEDTTPTLGGTLDCNNNHLDDIATAHYNSWTTGDSGTAIDLDFDTYQARTVTLNAANVAIELQTPRGPGAFKLILIQDGTGGRNVTWSTEGSESIYAPSGTLAPDTNANTRTLYGLIYDGSDWTCVKSGTMQTV